ncbi:oligosaccharide flippase family protein [Photobacterium kishitanii]|uniref:oligosaccharide flippase family protein n=1 Tax=Photobacterium kishitanii TaxID=318456 RepID=UPI000433BDE3|nr:oligosaccharide flippase family protein [Photobacterium kishitanii]CEO38465.1 Membrane protein involved in the export of O-antigen and teichoic acid [Photobacterium kishitanii]
MNFSLFKNISLLWLGSILGAGFSFISQAILARNLGTESYGVFSASLGTVNMLMPLAGFGVAAFWLKAFGQEGWNGTRWLSASFKFIFSSSVLLVVCLSLWAFYGPNGISTRNVLLILSFMIFGLSVQELFFAKLQLEEAFGQYTFWQLITPLLRLLVICIFYFIGVINVTNIAISYTLLSFIVLIISVYHLNKIYLGNFKLKGHGISPLVKNKKNKKNISELISGCWVFGLSGMFYIVWSQSNVIILKYMVSDHDAGIYSVIVLIINAICILPTVIYTKYLLPKIHRWEKNDLNQLRKIFIIGNKTMFLFGLLSMLLILLFSKWFILLAFGDEYKESISLLMLLSVILPVRFVGHSIGSLLVVNEHMKQKIKVMGFVALLNIVLNLIFIPILGVLGVIVSSIICEIVLVSLYYILVKRKYIDTMWSIK